MTTAPGEGKGPEVEDDGPAPPELKILWGLDDERTSYVRADILADLVEKLHGIYHGPADWDGLKAAYAAARSVLAGEKEGE